MTEQEIITYIYKNRSGSKKPERDTSRVKELLNKIGNPQNDLKFVHIAGTNGKGSTTTMLANVLKASGYKVGKYISPYIISFNERIQINNEFISNEELEEYINELDPYIKEMESENNAPNGFEIITTIAFMHYKKNNCDIVCLETGMGGRLDPTNVIETTLVSVITLIDYDHMAFLGDTLEKIAFEKCGIIKNNKITVTYPLQQKEVLNTIRAECSKKNNKLYIPNIKLLDIIKCNRNINYFSYKSTYYKLNLIGEHQIYNALMVILTANVLITLGYKISFSAITNGLFATNFPARLEKISDNPTIIIDGSHNPSGAKSLKSFLHEYKGKKIYAIYAAAKGKNYKDFIDEIAPCVTEFIFVNFDNEYKKSENIDDILKYAKSKEYNATSFKSKEMALEYASSKENVDLILITGSLYLASNYRDMLTKE